ncbi:MAG: hypothetical protein WC071_14255, partial [Victivallaceae bacterium]
NVAPNGSSKTQMFNLNPKWNTKYLDFLTAKGHAKVVTYGDLVIRNNKVGLIERKTNIFNVDSSEKIPDTTFGLQYMAVDQKQLGNDTTAAYSFVAYDTGGTKIVLAGGAPAIATLTVTKETDSSNITRYYLKLADTALYFTKNGANYGNQVEAGSFALYKGTTEQTAWNSSLTLPVDKGNKILVEPSPSAYGFKITVAPSVCDNDTILDVEMSNDSLIGWKSDGGPRISKNNTVNTKVMISNDSNRFVIGGLEKKEVVRGVTGIPFLKDLPVLGWVFSTESESTKHSQLIMVAECVTSRPDTQIKDGIHGDIMKLNQGLEHAGKTNNWGFQQLGLDKQAN